MTVAFEILSPKVMSTNDMYMHPVRKCKDGRYRSFVCKSPSLKEFQAWYEEKLKECIDDESVTLLQTIVKGGDLNGLSLKIEYGMPENELYEHDASNFIKSIEDCIVKRIGVDDSRNLSVSVEKRVLNNFNGEWALYVEISTMKVDTYDHPRKVEEGSKIV